MFNDRKKCLCAFCGNIKKVYTQKNITFIHMVLCFMVSLFFMWSFWQTWDLRSALVFLTCLCVMEILIHIRWRLSLVCKQCGFDPLVYLKNKNLAASQVKSYLDRRKLNPNFLLAPTVKIKPIIKNSKSKNSVPNKKIIPSTKVTISDKGRELQNSL